jgi:hypothetical protein
MPFAGYKDFADCTSRNRDKGDPDAYCGAIKRDTEDKAMNEVVDHGGMMATVGKATAAALSLATAIFRAGHQPPTSWSGRHANRDKTYLAPGEEPPEGVDVKQGKRGGRYYVGPKRGPGTEHPSPAGGGEDETHGPARGKTPVNLPDARDVMDQVWDHFGPQSIAMAGHAALVQEIKRRDPGLSNDEVMRAADSLANMARTHVEGHREEGEDMGPEEEVGGPAMEEPEEPDAEAEDPNELEEEVGELTNQLTDIRDKLKDMASMYPSLQATIEAYIIPGFDDLIGEGPNRNPYNQSLTGLVESLRERQEEKRQSEDEERYRSETPESRRRLSMSVAKAGAEALSLAAGNQAAADSLHGGNGPPPRGKRKPGDSEYERPYGPGVGRRGREPKQEPSTPADEGNIAGRREAQGRLTGDEGRGRAGGHDPGDAKNTRTRRARGGPDERARERANDPHPEDMKGGRTYLAPGEQPPPGVDIKQGERGGRYYEGGKRGGGKPQPAPSQKPPVKNYGEGGPAFTHAPTDPRQAGGKPQQGPQGGKEPWSDFEPDTSSFSTAAIKFVKDSIAAGRGLDEIHAQLHEAGMSPQEAHELVGMGLKGAKQTPGEYDQGKRQDAKPQGAGKPKPFNRELARRTKFFVDDIVGRLDDRDMLDEYDTGMIVDEVMNEVESQAGAKTLSQDEYVAAGRYAEKLVRARTGDPDDDPWEPSTGDEQPQEYGQPPKPKFKNAPGSRFSEHGDAPDGRHVSEFEDEDLNPAELWQKVAGLTEDHDDEGARRTAGNMVGKLAAELDAANRVSADHVEVLARKLASAYQGVPKEYIDAALKRVQSGKGQAGGNREAVRRYENTRPEGAPAGGGYAIAYDPRTKRHKVIQHPKGEMTREEAQQDMKARRRQR